jgi:tetratricopeptide (TPR) repeat protein
MSWLKLDRIRDKLLESALLRQLFYERWFRVAFAGCVLLLIFLALFLPKIWTTSGPGVMPVIKVSGLDLVQAWSLKRSALKAMADGKYEEANYAWQAALANNRADPELVRGILRNILQAPRRRETTVQALSGAFWLLNLTGTNRSDLDLAIRVFENHHYYDGIVDLLGTRTNELSAPLEAAYLKALFHRGMMEAFQAHWMGVGASLEQDAELRLYRAAYFAGWGPPGTIVQARQELEAASEHGGMRLLACRLLLSLTAHQLDADAYGQVLGQLREWREDTLTVHAGYWRLLLASGRKSDAAALAQAHPYPPATPSEAVELVRVYGELGLRDQALHLLRRYASDFGHAPTFWIIYANALLEVRHWEELRSLAIQMRAQDAVRDHLAGFSYFLEGRAELALGRSANAEAAFERIRGREFPYPQMGQHVADQLLKLGHAALARDLLRGLAVSLADSLGYWLLLFNAADQLKEVDLMLEAATHAHTLAPNHPVAVNNYAAALLIKRHKPDEAIRLTLQLYLRNPNSLYAVVNHSAALLLNQRPQEAEVLLQRIQTNGLSQAQMALFNLDLFELHFSLRRFEQAWEISDRIEPHLLYPTQQAWFEQARRQMPPRPQTAFVPSNRAEANH